MTWDGDEYQKRFDALAAEGVDVHGEADFVMRFAPASVLDAGCGTGRVARELARRGVAVVGVDADASMVGTARRLSPDLDWRVADLCSFDLGRTFDVVLMAGNVPLFTPPGTQPDLVAGCARHVEPGGLLVAGFSLDRSYDVPTYDERLQRRGARARRAVGDVVVRAVRRGRLRGLGPPTRGVDGVESQRGAPAHHHLSDAERGELPSLAAVGTKPLLLERRLERDPEPVVARVSPRPSPPW